MSKTGTLDDLYLEWLYKEFIGAVTNPNPDSTYWKLAKQLYTTPFVALIRNDENRAEDGKQLRRDFINACCIEDVEVNWLQIDCSVLEVLIGLACRASFESWGAPGDWFWKLLRNIDFQSYNDRTYSLIVAEEVDAIVRRLLDRSYEKNGAGGLFPLEHARQDQTKEELWNQLQLYLLEGNYLEHGP